MTTSTDLDLDLDLTTDQRPECAAMDCSNEAVWRYLYQRPCGCPWEVCQPHKESVNNDRMGVNPFDMYICGVCGHNMGRFMGWERV